MREIVIPIETTGRELSPKLLLATALAREGCTVWFGDKPMTMECVARLRNVIYLDKGFHRGTSEAVYRAVRDAGGLLASLDEENGVDFRDFHMLNKRMPDDFFPWFDRVFVWGRAQYAHLQANREAFPAERVKVTGHPRFDLLKPRYLPLYQEAADALRRRYGSFVLFNTNSKYSNNINSREHVIANYRPRVKRFDERLEYDELRLARNVALIRRIAGELGRTVVIRPHPEENIETYRELFRDDPGVLPLYEDTALNWILAADVVIHNHSTTGLEAAMLDKGPIAYNPVDMGDDFAPWIPVAVSHRCMQDDEVLALIRDGGYREEVADARGILEDFFTLSGDATETIVHELLALAMEHGETAPGDGLGRALLRHKTQEWIQRLRGRESQSKLARNKLRDLNNTAVRARFDTITQLMGVRGRVKVSCLHPRLYRIQPA